MEPVELRAVIVDLSTRLSDARAFLDVEGKEAELVDLKELASAPGLWNNQDKAREVTSKLAHFEGIIKHVGDLQSSVEDVGILLELAVEENDAHSLAEVQSELDSLTKELAVLERESLFFGEFAGHRLPNPTPRIGADYPFTPTDAPALGDDTNEILVRLGYDSARIQELRGLGVVS